MRDEIFKLIVNTLNLAIKTKVKINFKFENGLTDFYYDGSGQRDYYLDWFWPNLDEEKQQDSMRYRIVRNLSFQNEIDKGKQNAVLATFNLYNKLDKINEMIIQENESEKQTIITLDYLSIIIYWDRKVRMFDEKLNKQI